MDGLKRLLFSKGVSLKNVAARASEGGKGFGLYYTRDFEKGVKVLEVSRGTWEPYCASMARQEFCSSAPFQATLDKVGGGLGIREEQKATFEESVCLATKLLSAKDMGVSPYISFLEENSWPHDPTRAIHPLLLPLESLDLLSDCAAYRGLIARKRFHSVVGEFLFTAKNLNAYLWAMSLVLSRGISGRGYPFTMVPYIDLANHSMRPNAMVTFDEKTGSFALETTRNVAGDEELTISYGDSRNNSSIVGLYGFYEEDNLADDLMFTLSSGDGTASPSNYAVIPKAALTYYEAYKQDPTIDSSLIGSNVEQTLNVCRVVLKDALEKIFVVFSQSGDSGNFVDGIPTRTAELRAADLMLDAATRKIDILSKKRLEVEFFSKAPSLLGTIDTQSEESVHLRCAHWNQTCLRYIDGDLKDNKALIGVLEDFKAIVSAEAVSS